jgi:UDP-N-acetylmuramoyl-tripeptide--D-alanyl-D-alanine ligase
MSIYFFAFSIACYAVGIAPSVLYDIHMLQLSSYRNERYWGWIRQESLRSIHLGPLLALASLVLWPFVTPEIVAILWSAVFVVLFAIRDKTPQKKKLVITSRVIRLIIAHVALYGILSIVAWFILGALGYSQDFGLLLMLSILGVVSPLLLTLSNAAIQPVEKAVGRYYYNDANRILLKHSNLTTIGITGSYGKTSTKFILQQCLSTRYHTLATPESYNTTMGVIRVIRTSLRPIHELFIVEMGARQKGDIREICELAHPKLGIITAIGEQHLETFRDISTIARTKLELFESLTADGMAFYSADNQILREAIKPDGPRYVTYGIDAADSAYRAIDLSSSAKGTEFSVLAPTGESVRFRTKLLGRHNIYNILAAISVSSELGIPLAELVPVVASLKPAPHRLEVKSTSSGFTILDNAFSSNPEGAKSSLEVLGSLEGKRKIMITPGMVELGSREFELNKVFGKQAASVCDHVILVGAKRAIPIREGLLEAGYSEGNIYIATDLNEGQKHLNSMVREGDVVLYENDLPDNYNEVKA